ncbi:gluconate 2-dehydrogenase subunit 3 family protein [Niallia oryzisoli]|uniref:Gluconate 2-dehydrogenase subunit 3 family protein n=1 Tax=Niallia oryzisoli TaxID=1737571 RepID=A0ABZ2C8D1_9BACI
MSEQNSNNDKREKSFKEFSRRKFLKNSGMVAGGVVAGSLFGGFIGNRFQTAPVTTTEKAVQPPIDYQEARMFFKRKEDFEVLAKATEHIFPEDEIGPGAIGLGVPYFIDKQLAGQWGSNTKDYRRGPFFNPDQQSPLNRGEIFLQGVRKINEESKKQFSNPFIKLQEDQQIEILKAFEGGKVQMNKVSSAVFFALLRQATLEGAYSDPMYGGNKNMEGWKMKEFPGAQISYSHMVEEEEFKVIEPISLHHHN